MKYLRLSYLPLATATVLLSSSTALAADSTDFGTQASIRVTDPGNSGGGQKFSTVIYQAFTIFTWIAGLAAIFYLLLSGFQYITAGGDGDKAAKARTGIINAIIGIIVLMAAFFIFRAATNVGGVVGAGKDVGASL